MNIGLDIMGGDYAPDATIDGAILAAKELPASDTLFLFGDEDLIMTKLQEKGASPDLFTIVHAPEVIGMSESPRKAFTQKPHSSISIGFHFLKEGRIDAFASAGNSGAMVVGSMYGSEMIDGIQRPCTAVVLPKENGGSTYLLDIGTNIDVDGQNISRNLETQCRAIDGSNHAGESSHLASRRLTDRNRFQRPNLFHNWLFFPTPDHGC